ncbi:amidohydrolase/deacetylase family metallohydrolase [Orbaceae bacterium ESL0727]|nr:amidohydrolase/deacetylase family metallohydrolase [Orbaceae bacterium ESL0727]
MLINTPYDLVIKNGRLIDDTIVDITINQGKIVAIAPSLSHSAKQQLDLRGRHYVTAGWIDAHTHCFAHSPIYHDDPDLIGAQLGVTTVVDAGSTGAIDIDQFYALSQQAITHVYAFLNISKIGLIRQNELSDMQNIDPLLCQTAIAKYPHFIIGLKVRLSRSVVGDNDIQPLLKAKEIQKNTGLPIMVHIGNNPPDLDDIADLLRDGDIITHCFNGKPNKILDMSGNVRRSIENAIKRGVIMDIGHGGESFSFTVAERAKSLAVYPNTISSDIYSKNRLQGPVYSLAQVMTKFLCLDYSLKRIIDSVTQNPAHILRLPNKGQLQVGYDADLTIFDLKQEKITLSDAEGNTRQSSQQFMPLASIIVGQLVITSEGYQHDFSHQ